MVELLYGVEPFYVLTYLIAATVGAAGAGYKIIKLINYLVTNAKNQNKALIEMAAHSDSETNRLHPDRSPHLIKPTIVRILKDN